MARPRERIPCPICGSMIGRTIRRAKSHAWTKHGELGPRAQGELIRTICPAREGDSIEKAIADWDRFIADGSFVEKKVTLDD